MDDLVFHLPGTCEWLIVFRLHYCCQGRSHEVPARMKSRLLDVDTVLASANYAIDQKPGPQMNVVAFSSRFWGNGEAMRAKQKDGEHENALILSAGGSSGTCRVALCKIV